MQLQRKDVVKNLTAKGFEKHKKTNHDVFIYRNKQGQKTDIRTLVSRGTNYRTLYVGLVTEMAKQCRLTPGQFIELVDCSLSRDDYDHLVM